MKKLFTLLLNMAAFAAAAQQNKLLESSFWQSSPDVEAVKAAVAEGNNPSQMNAMSFDPTVLAINAQAPTPAIVYLLSQQGNDVNKLTHDGRTYLHWAAMRGNTDVVAYLLDHGAKVNVMDSHGSTPLLFAASGAQPNTKTYDLLLAHGDDLKKNINADGANALLLAVANDKDQTLTNYFVSKGLSLKSVDAAGNNAFAYAARSGNVELLKALLQKGVPVSPNAMLMAAQGGGGRRGGPAPANTNALAIYQYLESVGAKPTAVAANGENVLYRLVRKPSQGEVIAYFLQKGVDVNAADEDGNTPFMVAAAVNRDTAVLAQLLPAVKNINQANQKGATALALAVQSNSVDMVRYLINRGANVNALDNRGNNLAAYLIEGYRPATGRGGNPNAPAADDFISKIKLLQDKGLNLAAPQKDGNTLYHLAITKNDIGLLKKLEPLNIDINTKNKDGLTALHKAAMVAKDDAIMKHLIALGAKKELATNFNETAFALASENESLLKNNVSVNFLK